ncbi:hypothetical protein ABKN59_000790 [Abortiporus biennis]
MHSFQQLSYGMTRPVTFVSSCFAFTRSKDPSRPASGIRGVAKSRYSQHIGMKCEMQTTCIPNYFSPPGRIVYAIILSKFLQMSV